MPVFAAVLFGQKNRHALALLLFAATSANAAGVVTSKQGAKAYVSAAAAPKFQAYVNDLEARGAKIYSLGGYRKGRCSSGSLHPCGKAMDVCQTRRGRVEARCRLPSRHELARIAAAHGLFEGGQWCNSDMGHVQTVITASRCGQNLYAAVEAFHAARAAAQ